MSTNLINQAQQFNYPKGHFDKERAAVVEQERAKLANAVDMSKIFQIESSWKGDAHNVGEDARGLGQLRPPVLAEWNKNNEPKFTPDDLFNEDINAEIATWYMNDRIPNHYFKAWDIEDSIENRILFYNAGPTEGRRRLKAGEAAPLSTQDYIRKYFGEGE